MSADIRAVFRARSVASSPYAAVHMRIRGDHQAPRATVVAGRAVGNAVGRNRVKRRLRALLPVVNLRAGRDYVVVGKPGALRADSATLRHSTRRLVDTVEARGT